MLKSKYPNIIYRSDLSAGAKTPHMQNLIKILNSGPGFPDTQMYEPRGGYCGMMIEIKKKPSSQGESIYKVDGTLKKDEHLHNQAAYHEELRKRGWYVCFAEGADEAFEMWENYYHQRLKL